MIVGSMEGAHALATGNLVSLSEQELVDCVLGGADTCALGGFMQQGFNYVITAGGEETVCFVCCCVVVPSHAISISPLH